MRNVFLAGIFFSLCFLPAVAATNGMAQLRLRCDAIASEIPGQLATNGVRRIELRDHDWLVRVAPGADETASDGSYDVRLYAQTNAAHIAFLDGLVLPCDGCLKQAWLADLNHDGRPEIAVWVVASGPEKQGVLDLFEIVSDEEGDGLQEVELPEAAQSWLRGHRGGDSYRVEHGALFWTFPVYRGDDRDDHPTGGETTLKLIFERERWMWRLDARK